MTSRICPTCGNVLQPYMHGSCTVCARNAGEFKRYGRRRPSAPGRGAAGASTRTNRPQKEAAPERRPCPICQEKLTADKFSEHMWSVHNTNPSTPALQLARLAEQWSRRPETADPFKRRRTDAAKAARQPLPTQECAVCGLPVARERLGEHQRNHRRREDKSSRQVRRGINSLLRDIYERPRLLSEILTEQGLPQKHIAHLQKQCLDDYVNLLLRHWYNWFRSLLSAAERAWLLDHYGLDGLTPAAGQQSPAASTAGSPEAKASFRAAMSVLRLADNRQQLERLALQAAREQLASR